MKAKKIFKGMTAAAIAAVLATTMVPMTAFAAGTTHTVTVTTAGVSEGTVKFYKVANITPTGHTYYTYTDDFASKGLPDLDSVVSSYTQGSNALKNYIATLSELATNPNYEDTIGNTVDVEEGYYLVITTATGAGAAGKVTAPTLVLVTADTNVETKANEIPFDKAIDNVTGSGTVGTNKGTAQVAVNDVVNFKITTSIPTYKKGVTELITDYVITDTPSIGLTYNNNAAIATTTGLVTPDSGETPTITAEGTGFKVTFPDAYVLANGGKEVIITYTATVNANAKLNQEGNPNTATLKFSNNYDGTDPNPTENDREDETKVYTTKIDVTKTFTNKDNVDAGKLAGAQFTLYKGSYNPQAPDQNKVAVSEETTVDNNVLTFKGLAAGTYVLVETKTPAGYKAGANKTFTIKTEQTDNEYTGVYTFENTTTNDGITVNNIEGKTLPGTGGIGTTIFTIAGVGVVVLAGAMLVVYMRKRKADEE